MTLVNNWFSVGPLIVREDCLATAGGHPLEVDLALTISGWEDRNLAMLDAVALSARECMILDFAVRAEVKSQTAGQIAQLGKHFGSTSFALSASTEVDRNIHSIKTEIRRRFPNGLNSLFIDITTIPRGYFQAILGWLFIEGLVGQIHVGYCEGVYGESLLSEPPDEGLARFSAAKPLLGATGPCREKRLIVALGKEKSSCYGLIEEMSPDYIDVLATYSDDYPELRIPVQAQVDRLEAVYAEQIAKVDWVDAFSLRALCDAINLEAIESRRDVATTIFAAGTKPHALAAGLIGVALKDHVQVRYRQKAAYDPRHVGIGRNYWLYTIADLRSGRLASCKIW
jgi:hypothetical protein